LPFWAVRRCRNHLATLYRVRRGRKSRIYCWNFDAICHSSRDNYFWFGGHIAISGCRSRLQSLVDTFFELYIIATRNMPLEFQCCVSQFQRYNYFRFRRPFPVVGHYWDRPETLSSSLLWSNTLGLPLEF